MMNAHTKARFALFNRDAKEADKPDTVYPLMTGNIENANFKLAVSAYLKANSNTGAKFLSLVIANEGDEQVFSGTLHRSTKPGKEDEYFGYIQEQFLDVVDGQNVYTLSDWQLGISAKVKTPEGKKKYIGGEVYSKLPKGAAAATSANSTPAEDKIAF